jgi:hypothetical protein
MCASALSPHGAILTPLPMLLNISSRTSPGPNGSNLLLVANRPVPVQSHKAKDSNSKTPARTKTPVLARQVGRRPRTMVRRRRGREHVAKVRVRARLTRLLSSSLLQNILPPPPSPAPPSCRIPVQLPHARHFPCPLVPWSKGSGRRKSQQ